MKSFNRVPYTQAATLSPYMGKTFPTDDRLPRDLLCFNQQSATKVTYMTSEPWVKRSQSLHSLPL